MQELLIPLLADLISFPSVSPNDSGGLDYIANYLDLLGAKTSFHNRNQTRNLIAELGYGELIFAFAGHVDVVPPGEINLWVNADPFKLTITENNLIGRGTSDMKGSLAAFLIALKNFIKVADVNKYKIMVLITSDEEADAKDGTIVMVEHLKAHNIRLNYCLVGEPSSKDQVGDTLKIGRRGSLTGNIIVYGKQGHIAYPHKAINPIHSFAKSLNQLVTKVWDNGDSYFPKTSFQFANLNSGLGVNNVIPNQLSANFNFRYNMDHTFDSLICECEAIFKENQLNYSINWIYGSKPFMAKLGRLVDYASAVIYDLAKIKPVLATDGGTSDGRFLVEVSDELCELGLRNNTIHELNESITLNDLLGLERIYFNILNKIFDD